MPPHRNLEHYLDADMEAAKIRDDAAVGRPGKLTEKPMNRIDAWRMIQRRAAELGARVRIACHTFRATGITAHESRTTKLYDLAGDEITLDEVERITI